ncbi:MAG: VWA domain-containing protein, partial [Terriglobus roseus]|nr:VWA domain-containing protein [Terriglobus roseus]
TDRNGRTVRDLSQSDFVVKEDGVEQKARLLETPDDAGKLENAKASHVQQADGMPQQDAAEARQRTLILLDEVNVSFADLALARNRLDVFLASNKAVEQPIALMALTANKLVLIHDFTTDRDALRKALRALPPALPVTANAAVDEYQDYVSFTHAISALETIGRSLQGSPVRTNCIWITSGFLTLAKLVNSPEMGYNLELILQHTANLYLGARMSVYTIDPHGVQFESSLPAHDAQSSPTGPTERLENDGDQVARQTTRMTSNSAIINSVLNKLDERTGGRGFQNQNFIDVPIAEAFDDASGSYLLAYAPSNRDFHGEYRHIQVTLRTPGLHARTRDGYIATNGTPDHSESEVNTRLERALESPLPYQGLQTSAQLTRVGKRPVLRVTVAPRNVEWQHGADGSGGTIAQVVAIAAYAKNGKPVFSRTYQVTTNRPDLQVQDALRYDLPFVTPSDSVRVRVAVMDRHGSNLGTAEVPLLDEKTLQHR